MIADLFFYTEFCGGDLKVPAAEFERWERCASGELARITCGKSNASKDECIKACVCEMAELLYQDMLRGEIVSENNDGYSVTYKNGDSKTELIAIAKRHLSGTDYLYRGVGNDN